MSTPPDRSRDTARQAELSYPAHRGLFIPSAFYSDGRPRVAHSSYSGLGMHWTANQRIAEEMASHAGAGTTWDLPHRNPHSRETPDTSGTAIIYHGEIPMSSVETDVDVLKNNRVLSPENLNRNKEDEIPVRKGAPVLVTGRTKSSLRNGVWKTRERTYKKPREMKG
jgi:hypothetical protein